MSPAFSFPTSTKFAVPQRISIKVFNATFYRIPTAAIRADT